MPLGVLPNVLNLRSSSRIRWYANNCRSLDFIAPTTQMDAKRHFSTFSSKIMLPVASICSSHANTSVVGRATRSLSYVM